jgi:hypothetical protein
MVAAVAQEGKTHEMQQASQAVLPSEPLADERQPFVA